MTVSYSARVSNSALNTFVRLLFRWRGSIYKLMYREMIIFLALYYVLNFTYRFALDSSQKKLFEKVCVFFGQYSSYVPLTFILGFYVNMIVTRWWSIYTSLTWPDTVVLAIVTYIPGVDYRCRLIRRSLVRWLSLSNILMLRSTSSVIRKRFPSINHLKEAGFITQDEMTEFESYNYPSHSYWVPLRWCHELLKRCRLENRIENDRYLLELVQLVSDYRKSVASMLDYDWISLPLVYTQVVTLAVYTFFAATLLSRQSLDPSVVGHENDIYFPVFTTFQFVFYMGWLKVAETLINPLGEDDDDFEVNWIVDRNLKYSYLVVDEMCDRLPNLCEDIHWNKTEFQLPYTEASLGVKDGAPVGSASGIVLTEAEARVVTPLHSADHSVASSLARQPSLKEKIARNYSRLRSTISQSGEIENGQIATDHLHCDTKEIVGKLATIEEYIEQSAAENNSDPDETNTIDSRREYKRGLSKNGETSCDPDEYPIGSGKYRTEGTSAEPTYSHAIHNESNPESPLLIHKK